MGNPTARVWFGAIIAAAGAALLFLGWYGVSGESSVAEQVPYLASATIPGAALLIVGVMLAAREREGQSAERLVSTLYELLTEPVTDAPATAPSDDRLVALPDAARYHRPSCVLISGKNATTVDSHAISERGLEPCPLCIVGPPAG
jgi:multisubunit Na+/H+ antiporter MnhG subunit